MPKLGVNIDHVATLRQARSESFPDPIKAALICQDAGADSIVAHLREDRRHIQDRDIVLLKKKLTIGLNMEMSIHPTIVQVALKAQPDKVTLVPERRQEQTTESGLNVKRLQKKLSPVLKQFAKRKIPVSLFIDPDIEQIRLAKNMGVPEIEIHTGGYAKHFQTKKQTKELTQIQYAIDEAHALGLVVHVGHGLDYSNVQPLLNVAGIQEFNIGFSIVSRALFVGLAQAVKEMRQAIKG